MDQGSFSPPHTERSYDEMWRRTSATLYWLRDIWILPIHRRSPSSTGSFPGTTTTVEAQVPVITLSTAHFFPSSANLYSQVSSSMPIDMGNISRSWSRKGGQQSPTVSRPLSPTGPLLTRPSSQQSKPTVLRGYHAPLPDEELMPLLRDLLRRQVLGLPFYRVSSSRPCG
ncbi:hypothetical protein Hypma_001341 [Hypsizygus marmoreus]|uniref:Uncharacterized protein n=1 Tax=Hypsizygus marmoreus TaxID=39966 RepID=A0A369K6R1_HYPMA|nr:hypothetical protein Hypma_001341 [Hypsizygus marmoreus]